jgi:hypothetical protein
LALNDPPKAVHFSLHQDPFPGNKTEDAHEHIDNVLYIVSLFNISGVSHDVIMLRVFPMTLTGAAQSIPDDIAQSIPDD